MKEVTGVTEDMPLGLERLLGHSREWAEQVREVTCSIAMQRRIPHSALLFFLLPRS